MQRKIKATIVAALLVIGLAAQSQQANAAGDAKPADVQKEVGYEVLSIDGANSSGGTPEKCGLFDGIQLNNWQTPDVMYWNHAPEHLEIDIKETCNIWRSGVSSYPQYSAPLRISKWNGTEYIDITATITQTTSLIGNTQWEKTISNLPAGRYWFGAGSGLRLDSEWYLEAAEETPAPTTNTMKAILEPAEELLLSVDENLSKNTGLNWTSSEPAVATVGSTGIVTAVSPGNTIITVQDESGAYQESIQILVHRIINN